MADRALIAYTNDTTSAITTLTIEQAGDIANPVYTKDTLVAWATSNAPVGSTLASVCYSPDFEELYP